MARQNRAGGEGSLWKDEKRKRWIGQHSVPGTGGTKKRRVSAKSKAECLKKMRDLYAELHGLTFKPADVTFGEHLDRWLEDDARNNIKPSTYRRYKSSIRLHIKPELGGVKLENLTAAHLQSFYAKKMRGGMASGTVRLLHAIVGKSLSKAKKWRLIQTNPAEDAEAPKLVPTKKSRALTKADALRLLERIRAWREDRYALFLLAVSTGMRQGEILALKWKNVNLETGVVNVEESVDTMVSPPEWRVPKGGKPRTIKLSLLAVEALKVHARMQEEQILRTLDWQDWGLVFTGPTGDVIRRSVLYESFVRLLRREGFPTLTFHELRHGAATLLFESGAPAKAVQELLGHSTYRITMDTYTHLSERMRDETAFRMDEILSESD